MLLLLEMRDYGRAYTVEYQFDEDQVREFREKVRYWVQRLRNERMGRIRDDSPIVQDVLIVR